MSLLCNINCKSMILALACQIHGEHDIRSALLEEGSHRVGAVAERRESGVIEHEEVEGLAIQFGEISAQPPRPQDAKIVKEVRLGQNDDILRRPYWLGRAD